MPKQTFFNLPEEKQEVIKQAAKKEFSRVTVGKASIAHIIKEADIPRGSFYQYFEDKDDLFLLIVTTEIRNKLKQLIEHLKMQKGDMILAIETFFAENVSALEDERQRNLERNIFLSMTERIRCKFEPGHGQHPCKEEFHEMLQLIDNTKLSMLTEEERNYLGKMLGSVLVRLLTQLRDELISKEECIKLFEFEMKVIKRGINY